MTFIQINKGKKWKPLTHMHTHTHTDTHTYTPYTHSHTHLIRISIVGGNAWPGTDISIVGVDGEESSSTKISCNAVADGSSIETIPCVAVCGSH